MASLLMATSETSHHWLDDALIYHVRSSRFRWGLVGVLFRRRVPSEENMNEIACWASIKNTEEV